MYKIGTNLFAVDIMRTYDGNTGEYTSKEVYTPVHVYQSNLCETLVRFPNGEVIWVSNRLLVVEAK